MRLSWTLLAGLLAPMLIPLGAATLQSREPAARPSLLGASDSVPVYDPIARLQERIDRGEVVLSPDTALGYLPDLLRELKIPVSSQTLVFSRTSLQTDKIAPWSPRAIYFNDDVYIGYVQGSDFLEIASIDPEQGPIFYTLNQVPEGRPLFQRESTACTMCHTSRAVTDGVPGLIVLSTLADRHGYPIGSVHGGSTSERTPHEQRWGGWYVTGTHGETRHSGNTYSPLLHNEVPDKQRYRKEFDLTVNANLTSLHELFDTEAYLTGHSDIVALMVLAHQSRIHNLITAAQEHARAAVEQEPGLLAAGAASGSGPRSSGQLRIDGAASRLADAMLFEGEVPLSGPVRGTSGFSEEFARLGPTDSRGRSLRDLDLERRLFRYPLSFLIYSDQFDALPEIVRRSVYRRLWTVLKGEDPGSSFSHLREAERRAILEILEETKPEFVRLRAP